MNPINNPYNPGAGVPPPELAGRENILNQAENTITRTKNGKPAKSLILLGLRGVGKTVLLNRIDLIAETTFFIVNSATILHRCHRFFFLMASCSRQ